MSLDLTAQEVDAIWMEAEQDCPPAVSIDRLETIYTVPSRLGSGYRREMELYPGLSLSIFNETLNNLTFRGVEHQHLVQFMVHLSGVIDSGDLLYQDATQSYIGSSGIQKAVTTFTPVTESQVGVNIHLEPHLLYEFFAAPTGELPIELQLLVQGEDWQRMFSTKTTGAIRSVVQQMIDCPLMGMTKRLYLQGKVFELMALQLDSVLAHPAATALPRPDTIARIRYAAEILRSQLEEPPSQAELAQQVGVAYCTLHKGFRSVFGVTPFAYLTQQRMKQAECLLRQPNCSVASVANQVGYTNSSHFAAAFKRQFGMTPREFMCGKK